MATPDAEKRAGLASIPSSPVQLSKEDEDAQVIPENNLPLVFTGLMLSTFLAALDMTIVSTALATIVADLGGGDSYSWVGSAYMIAAAALSPLYGKLSDIFGRKQIFFPCVFIFLLGSALCGAAQTMTWLIVARAVQGIGAGGVQQLVQIVIGDIVPLEKRGSFSSLAGATWGIASVVGPVVGGTLAGKGQWRWCFWLNLPTGAVASTILFFFLKLNPREGKKFRDVVREFDFIGLFLLVGGIVCLLLGFSQSQHGWDQPATIALLAVGGAMLVVGVAFEMLWIQSPRSPIIPPRLFRTRTTGFISLTTFLHAFVFFCGTFYFPLYLQVRGSSPLRAGVLTIPFAVLTSLTSALGGIVTTKIGDFRPPMWIGFSFMTLGYGLMITLDEKTPIARAVGYSSIVGFGAGWFFLPPLIGFQAAMPTREMATTSATFLLIKLLGSSIGISIGEAVWSSAARKQLAKISDLTLDLSGAALTNKIPVLKDIEPESLKAQVLHAYSKGISTVWIMSTPILGVCLLATLVLKNYSQKRKIILRGRETQTMPMERAPRPVSAALALESGMDSAVQVDKVNE
ncbi:MFS general substrate transporter [Roridomyces roridus]|uniref:MFS general substrate transporter n=1 Tax=Roridomyces roridus TaxID=1738132 RepID=A0AAD7C8B8_9AGAR|nr:MFS general substrate transporter [Roridomyces roridus]